MGRFWFYVYEEGLLKVNFEATKSLKNFIVVYRKVFVPETIRELLVKYKLDQDTMGVAIEESYVRDMTADNYLELKQSAAEEVYRKQQHKWRAGAHVLKSIEEYIVPDSYQLVPVLGEIASTDYPYNYGVTVQKSPCANKAFFFCLASDSCRLKKLQICVRNLRFKQEEETRHPQTLSKVRVKDVPKLQYLEELDQNDILAHLREFHSKFVRFVYSLAS